MALWIFMNISFSHGGGFGHSRVAILDGIDRFGSISASARSVGLTYQAVWSAIWRLNREFPEPLVTIRRSGRSSGALLTPMGKEIVVRFREIESLMSVLLQKQFSALELVVGDDPKAPAPIPRWAYPLDPQSMEAQKKRRKRGRTKAKPATRPGSRRPKSVRSSKRPRVATRK
jgi:molybdate transport system regulatory protein